MLNLEQIAVIMHLNRLIGAVALSIFVAAGASSSLAAGNTPLPGDVTGPIQPTSVIMTSDGPINGVDDGKMLSWLGVPYAAPPVNELRWRPPQAPEKWTAVREANRLSPACVQNADLGVFASPGGNEDCLYLNVYADRQAFSRARASGEKLPVFVWIHGGALWVGQGADYNPRALVADGKAIVVTFNYRLGMFGFFAHPALAKEGHPVINYGQMDQTQILRWVRDNIASFGGDPQNVTISGESSGGNSVVTQILTPWSAGLFQNAIEMSGAAILLREPNFGSVGTVATAERKGEGFAAAVGCDSASDVAACLRALTPAHILAHQYGFMLQQTAVDGDFLPDWPSKLLEDGKFNRVRLISGTTRDEGDFFAALPELESGVAMTPDSYPTAIRRMYGDILGEAVLKEYPVKDYLNASEAYSATVTDYLFACASLRLKRLAARHTEVWGYEFADRTAPSYLAPTTFRLRAAHTFELPYLFPGFHGGRQGTTPKLNRLQTKLAEQLQTYWTSAGRAGTWQSWPRFSSKNESILQMGLPASQTITAADYASAHKCRFWDAQGVY